MKNKKAQIATALLVMIALGLSAAALFAIVSFSSDYQFQSSELDRITNQLNFQQNYVLEQSKMFGASLVKACSECSESQLKKMGQDFDAQHVARTQDDGNFFAKLRNGEFEFNKQTNKTSVLKIKGIHIQASSGYNLIERDFGICQTFNETGDFVKDCQP